MKKSDRELGMNRDINRRDFPSGMSNAIANSAAAAACLTQAAFDQAHRAVHELIAVIIRPGFQYPWNERT